MDLLLNKLPSDLDIKIIYMLTKHKPKTRINNKKYVYYLVNKYLKSKYKNEITHKIRRGCFLKIKDLQLNYLDINIQLLDLNLIIHDENYLDILFNYNKYDNKLTFKKYIDTIYLYFNKIKDIYYIENFNEEFNLIIKIIYYYNIFNKEFNKQNIELLKTIRKIQLLYLLKTQKNKYEILNGCFDNLFNKHLKDIFEWNKCELKDSIMNRAYIPTNYLLFIKKYISYKKLDKKVKFNENLDNFNHWYLNKILNNILNLI